LFRRQHLFGLFIGALLGLMAAGLGTVLGYGLALDDGLFWGAAIGATLASVPDFARSGAVLTRGDNQAVNLIVGLVGSVLFLGAFVGLVLVLLNLFA
jgi:hypothetical protein